MNKSSDNEKLRLETGNRQLEHSPDNSPASRLIPRRIHFVWLGSKLPQIFERLIIACQKLHSGWQVKVWGQNEVEALAEKLGTGLAHRIRDPALTWSTKSDLARYHIIFAEGGIYFDTDFLVLRELESLRKCGLFAALQEDGPVGTAVFGARAQHPVFGRILQHLRGADYSLQPDQLAGPGMFTRFCRKSVARNAGTILLSPQVFFPVNHVHKHELRRWAGADLRGTYAAHLWAHSWGRSGGDDEASLYARIGALEMNFQAQQKQGDFYGIPDSNTSGAAAS
jgi:hypothetical protein